MSKKKHRNRIVTAPKESVNVRLSQVTIVKNEEGNIEQALSWGRGIVCEQIVVDTGSSDRTVEMAEKLGAKVLHFEWIGDFAAAKNFAIEQAGGDWIAFLDADEYFPQEDASKVAQILSRIASDPDMRSRYLAVVCPWYQLDDDGKTMDVFVQSRLFRNLPQIRYTGRIHEELTVDGQCVFNTEDIRIMHTGYSASANKRTGKSAVYIDMLRLELAGDPDNLKAKLYLADALVSYANERLDEMDAVAAGVAGIFGEAPPDVRAYIDEAVALYKEVAKSDVRSAGREFKVTAYRYLLGEYAKTPQKDAEYDDLASEGYKEFPDEHRITCYYAAALIKNGRFGEAFEILQKLEERQENPATRSFAYSIPDMVLMCRLLIDAAQGLGDMDSVFKYTTAILSAEKTNTAILGIYINMLYRQLKSYDYVLEILSMMYNLKNAEDAAIIAEAAKSCGADDLAVIIDN